MAIFNLSKSYNFSEVVLTIGGFRIGGYDEDGGVEVSFTGDDASMSQGADGETTINQLPEAPAEVTVTLKETSVSNGVMGGLREAQRAAAAGYVLPFLLTDAATGETVASAECAFANRPAVTKNKEAGSREWKLFLPHPKVIYASA